VDPVLNQTMKLNTEHTAFANAPYFLSLPPFIVSQLCSVKKRENHK